MKNATLFFKYFIIAMLLFASNCYAQTGDNCSTAISVQNILNVDDTSIVMGHPVNWYEFQNDSSFISFEFLKAKDLPNLGEFYRVQILKGNCLTNAVLFDTTIVHGTNTLSFELDSQSTGTYYIRIENMDTINCPSCIAPYNLGLSLKNASYSSIPWPSSSSAICPNIILNASFETTNGTPTCQGISGFLNNWGQMYSPDWFTFNNTCAITNIPSSTWFGTIANPPSPSIVISNNAYVGVVTALFQNGVWDSAVKEKLVQTTPFLKNGKRYLVRAKVALAPGTQYTSNNMNIKVSSANNIIDNPQLSAPMLTTPNIWVQLENTFVSDGTENKIVVGNNSNSTGGNLNTVVSEINPNSVRSCAYYFVDDIELYRMANAGPDVTISECNPKQIGTCAFPSATYLWTPATGLSSSVNAQPFAMPTQTTQYIIQVTYWLSNGNTATDFDTVTVTVPPCNCFANAGPDITILDCLPATIGPDCINPNLTYSWSPALGLNDPNIPNPLALPGINTSYVLTVTYTNPTSGYTFIDYDTVNVNVNTQACISTITPNLISPIIYASSLGNALTTNSNYAIDGTINVNIPVFNISNIDLVLGPNTQFVIFPNCSLIIDNSYLHGCCAMWQGIKVFQNASVAITGYSVIEDADTAVTILFNGSYQLSNSTFNKNYVDVAAIGTINYNQTATVENCTFDCNDTQMPQTFNQYGLRPPMLGLRSAIAISAKDVNPLNIGTSNLNANSFMNHDYGLFINNVTLTANYNTFNTIDDNSINTYNFNTAKGINVHLENSNYGNYSATLIGNTFVDGLTAINAFNGYNGYFIQNNITGMSNYGIVFLENAKRTFRINHNIIDNVTWIGIYGLNNHNTISTIYYNTINNSINKLFRTAIGLDETTFSNVAFNKQIVGNIINNHQYGITTTRLVAPYINSNTINIQQTPWEFYAHGIKMFENFRAEVYGNTIFGNNRDEYFVDGIRTDNGDYAKIKCNYTVKTGSGAFFVGPAVTDADLKSNIFLKDFWGVVLAAQAVIGGQGNSTTYESFANQWIGSMGNPDYAHTFAYDADGTNSPFYTLIGYPWEPTINNALGAGANQVATYTVGTNQNDNCLLYRDSIDSTVVIIAPIHDSINEWQLLQRINSAQNGSYTNAQAWWLKASAYNRLDAEDTLSLQNFDLIMFKDSVDSAAFGKFTNINKMLSDTILDDIDSLRTVNSTLNTSTDIEENIKIVNELNMLRIKNRKLDADKIEQLRIIAALCPFEEGPAVYTARVLLRGIDDERQEYMHECEKVYPTSSSNRSSETKSANNITDLESNFLLTPNPALSFIKLVQNGEINFIQITEINGKVVFECAVKREQNSQTFDVSGLSNGIYIVNFFSEKKNRRAKLIINK